MTLGGKLLELRKSKGLSQEQLAAQMAVSRQAVSKWELGEAMPDTDNVVALSKIFGVSTDFLLRDELDGDAEIPAAKETRETLPHARKKRTILLLAALLLCAAGIALLLSAQWWLKILGWPFFAGAAGLLAGYKFRSTVFSRGICPMCGNPKTEADERICSYCGWRFWGR
ncbi:MAG: helix-turn-helix transcriptional regulator [Clostridiaceae bacterium]|nr:helix-turn-helix domain-containing protein [Eubacteriales bacterium]